MITYEKHTVYVVGEDGQATAEVFRSHISRPDAPGMDIPEAPGNRNYDQMMAEVAAGDAEIIEVDDTVLPDYAAMRRRRYPSEGDQLDAIWKQLNQDRMSGKDLVHDADVQLNAILAVKAAHPKELP